MAKNEKYWIIVPAAGIGTRMGSEIPKQYLTIAGRSILEWTLHKLDQLDNIQKIILVLHPQDTYWHNLKQDSYKSLEVVNGGDERFDSVLNGLEAIKPLADENDWVLVHDAVRPCVSLDDIEKLVSACAESKCSGGLLAAPVKDTLKRSNAENLVEQTLDRSRHWLAATPQMFRYGLLCNAMQTTRSQGVVITDEAAAMEAVGHSVKLVEGRSDNIKVTHPADLPLVEFLLKSSGALHAS